MSYPYENFLSLLGEPQDFLNLNLAVHHEDQALAASSQSDMSSRSTTNAYWPKEQVSTLMVLQAGRYRRRVTEAIRGYPYLPPCLTENNAET